MFCLDEGGHFQTVEQGWAPLFSVSEGAVPAPHMDVGNDKLI